MYSQMSSWALSVSRYMWSQPTNVREGYETYSTSVTELGMPLKPFYSHKCFMESNVIYGVPAQYPDAAHHGNHWNTKCIFYYLHN